MTKYHSICVQCFKTYFFKHVKYILRISTDRILFIYNYKSIYILEFCLGNFSLSLKAGDFKSVFPIFVQLYQRLYVHNATQIYDVPHSGGTIATTILQKQTII